MDAGILNRRVWLDRRTTVQDSSGDPVVTWEPVAEVWASIKPGIGREDDLDSDIMAEGNTMIRLRYLPVTIALTPVDRIRYGERIYNIVRPIDVDEAHREIRVEVTSGLNDG